MELVYAEKQAVKYGTFAMANGNKLIIYILDMSEQSIQSKIIKKLERDGFFVVKLIKTNKTGIPDLLAVKPNRAIFIEVKQEQGEPSPIQKYRINEIRNKKIECYIWTNYRENFDRKDPFEFKL